MEEDLAKQWERFNLLDVETEEVEAPDATLEPLVDRGTACAVGKLLADRTVGKEILKTPMIRAWHPTGWVSFKTLGPNLFLIEFEHEWDKTRILEGRPWKFDSDLFSMADFDGRTPPSELEFEKVAFWVRMYNMPLACMSREMGQRIGASMGDVEEVDVDEVGVGWGEFLRVRIVLDLTKPLSRGRFLKLRDRTIWITFRYERIPRFCFKCGVIRHGGRGCVRPGGRKLQENENMQEFGPWLRVSPTNRYGGGRGESRGKFNDAKKEYPSNSAASEYQANGGSKQGETEGGGSTETGGGTSDTSPASLMARTAKMAHINEGGHMGKICGNQKRKENGEINEGKMHYLQGDGISGKQKWNDKEDNKWEMRRRHDSWKSGKKIRKDGGEFNVSNKGINIQKEPILGSSVNEGKVCNKDNKEHIPSTDGKNIYVGQWDHIKEKMTWQMVEKGAEVVGNFNIGCSTNHVDVLTSIGKPAKGIETSKGLSTTSNSKMRLDTGRSSPVGDFTTKDQWDTTDVHPMVKSLAGKRKKQGESYDSASDGGKRTKATMVVHEDCNSEKAEAAMQPRQSK